MMTDAVILIVDDTPTNLRVLADYLGDYDFEIITALNGEDGLDKAQKILPDIILLDVMMPGIDGFETCRQLKANEATQDIPVIFMTALASEDDKVKGFEAGAVDYVTKPIQQKEVLMRLTTHLQIRAQAKLLQEQAARLLELNASKDKFFSIIAHDLKGPFLPLLGNLELMQEMAAILKPPDIEAMSASSYRSAKLVFDLLDNLLTWARLQMGRMDYQPEAFELQPVVQQAIEVLNVIADAKQIKLQNNVPATVSVYTDERMVDLVIRNLVNNALKFTPSGGQVTISSNELEVRSEELKSTQNSSLLTPNYVEVSITDTGVGMSEEVRQKLFKLDHHVTTMGTAKEQGTGLGLIICQEVIQKSGGRIWVESQVGQGTTVRFTVRAAEPLN